MKALAQTLTDAVENDTICNGLEGGEEALNAAAAKWAAYSLRTYKGPLLRRALAISAALADFTAWLEGQSSPPPAATVKEPHDP